MIEQKTTCTEKSKKSGSDSRKKGGKVPIRFRATRDFRLTTKAGDKILRTIEIGEVLGEGADGVVYAVKIVDEKGQQCEVLSYGAMKILKTPFSEELRNAHGTRLLPSLAERDQFLRTYPYGIFIPLPSNDSSSSPQFSACILSEKVPGKSLVSYFEQMYKKSLNLTFKERLLIALQLVCALYHMHSKYTLHSDIKPENIILEETRYKDKVSFSVRLVDFDFCTTLKHGLTDDQCTLSPMKGTMLYMPPEVSKRKKAYRSDAFSLATVLSELFATKSPFSERLDYLLESKEKNLSLLSRARACAAIPLNLEGFLENLAIPSAFSDLKSTILLFFKRMQLIEENRLFERVDSDELLPFFVSLLNLLLQQEKQQECSKTLISSYRAKIFLLAHNLWYLRENDEKAGKPVLSLFKYFDFEHNAQFCEEIITLGKQGSLNSNSLTQALQNHQLTYILAIQKKLPLWEGHYRAIFFAKFLEIVNWLQVADSPEKESAVSPSASQDNVYLDSSISKLIEGLPNTRESSEITLKRLDVIAVLAAKITSAEKFIEFLPADLRDHIINIFLYESQPEKIAYFARLPHGAQLKLARHFYLHADASAVVFSPEFATSIGKSIIAPINAYLEKRQAAQGIYRRVITQLGLLFRCGFSYEEKTKTASTLITHFDSYISGGKALSDVQKEVIRFLPNPSSFFSNHTAATQGELGKVAGPLITALTSTPAA